ncbi:MAG: hypothetical protein H6670_18995 [Anaerolineaceae bacterium]|nr:hypothetical protein [Anaerolineaceae bacterium]
MTDSPGTVSLLWPPGHQQAFSYDDARELTSDLNLRLLVRRLSLNPSYESFVRDLILSLSTEEDVIRYRQAVLSDLLHDEDLVLQLEVLLERILDLEGYLMAPQWRDNRLRLVAWRLSELDNYVNCVVEFDAVMQHAGNRLQSEALQCLRDDIHQQVNSPGFISLRQTLPELLPKIQAIRSVTIGVNLDDQLRPLSATLLDAHIERFVGAGILDRFFKRDNSPLLGKGPLHDARSLNTGNAKFHIELEDRNSPFMPQLFRDLSQLVNDTSRPVEDALKQFTAVNTRSLIALKNEIAFYLGAVKLIKKLRAAGLPMSAPEIVPMSQRMMKVQALYNINLALQLLTKQDQLDKTIVRNDAEFGPDGRIFILTGPNQGGKTTYTQAIGLLHLLAQAGLYVPASKAVISPVDGIYTHFATEERPEYEAGRLGEEARRLGGIFQKATTASLVLLNESLSSTAADESVFIARDVLRVLRRLGLRAVFATHLHTLAAEADAINADSDGDARIISVVSHVVIEHGDDGQIVRRTYEIKPGPPMSRSYAVELAARFGISYDQLTEVLRQRNLLD